MVLGLGYGCLGILLLLFQKPIKGMMLSQQDIADWGMVIPAAGTAELLVCSASVAVFCIILAKSCHSGRRTAGLEISAMAVLGSLLILHPLIYYFAGALEISAAAMGENWQAANLSLVRPMLEYIRPLYDGAALLAVIWCAMSFGRRKKADAAETQGGN